MAATETVKGERDLLIPAKEDEGSGSCTFIKARHSLALLAFLGFFNVYCLRVNLSVALVAMVNSTSAANSSVSDECPDTGSDNATTTETGEFEWDENTQGQVLAAFFYGYIVTQIPGGWLAQQVGGKRLFGVGVLCTAVLTLITPVAARAGIPYFLTVRVLEGLGEGVTFPAMHAIWSVWAPVYERSKLVSFSFAGAQLGTVFAMPISGLLCKYGFAGGWPSVFYVFAEERHFIESSIGQKKRLNTPWRHIFTSSALWATAAAHFTNNWGFYSMLTCLPTYMKKILKYNIQEDGFLSAVPYAILWVTQTGSGFIADFLRYRGIMTTQNVRKLMNTVGNVIPAVLMVATGYTGCNHGLATVLLTLGVGLGGFTMAGYNVNHLDIAPNFAGPLLGITNCIATIPGFLGPTLVGLLTNHNETTGQWRIFFFITAGIYLLGALVFLLLGQGEEQEWAKTPPSLTDAQQQVVTVQEPQLESKDDLPPFADSSSQ
ncbi:hypothetical protein BaRGS_00032856 [Batillaria attramentaria]|uniref:Sialin n=1 Tax=Batillaria attramentaria TaxID=370345 RepID=A0ABD0JMC9_9CAEN